MGIIRSQTDKLGELVQTEHIRIDTYGVLPHVDGHFVPGTVA